MAANTQAVQHRLLVSVGLAGLFAVCAAGGVQAAEDTDVIARVEKAWRDREKRYRSVHVEWTETQVQPAGWLSNLWLEAGGPRRARIMNPNNEVVPPKTTTLVVASKLDLQEEKLLYHEDRWAWHQEQKKHVPCPVTVLYDGKVLQTLKPNGFADMTWPIGTIIKRGPVGYTSRPELRPLIGAFRPLDPIFQQFDLKKYRMSTRSGKLDGKQLLVLERESHRGDKTILWMDAEQEYSIRREANYLKDRLQQQITVTHKHDSALGWVPQEWETITRFDEGKLTETCRGRVTVLTSGTIPASVFRLDFPPGTRVHDETKQKEAQDYITRDGSSPRHIHTSEIGKTYHELLQSEPPNRVPAWRWKWVWIGLVASLVVLAAVSWLVLCRGRKVKSEA